MSRMAHRKSAYNKLHRAGYRLFVPVTPSMRKLRALTAIGYSSKKLHQLTGISEIHVIEILKGKGDKIHIAKARAISDVFEQYSMKPLEGPHAARTRTIARKRGYAPPLAWDCIELDQRPKGVAA